MTSNSENSAEHQGAFALGGGYVAEHELMRAIILRAVEDFQSGGTFREEALEFFSDLDENEEYVFSFGSICRHLGFCPIKTRDLITSSRTHISTRRRSL